MIRVLPTKLDESHIFNPLLKAASKQRVTKVTKKRGMHSIPYLADSKYSLTVRINRLTGYKFFATECTEDAEKYAFTGW